MALSWWCNVNPASRTGLARCTMTINGLSWPHTERLEYTQGDSMRWRVVNFTELDHPMHLHGFYFRVMSKGDGVRDTVYAPASERMGVTEVVAPFQTLSLAWIADRAGQLDLPLPLRRCTSRGLVALDTRTGARRDDADRITSRTRRTRCSGS